MSKDPAFLFYPGDYLRDTQCLSESVQVSYDRIMCEHMRNICITQQQIKFFTKRLSDDEKDELMSVLTKKDGGFCIDWVVESIQKRRLYSESRRKNRASKKYNKEVKEEKDMLTYDEHMENEIENEVIIKEEIENPFSKSFIDIWNKWKEYKKTQFKFTYKTISTEQAAITELLKKSKGNEQAAIEIISQSIGNGWKGFFELKKNKRPNSSGLDDFPVNV